MILQAQPVTPGAPVNTMSNETYEDYEASCNEQGAQTIDDIINQFDENIGDTEDVKEAKSTFKSFLNYIAGSAFKEDVEETAEKYKVPPKQLAKNFITKALGILGDVLGIAVSTVGNVLHTILGVIYTIAKGTVDVLVKAGNAVARFVSFNQTNSYAAA